MTVPAVEVRMLMDWLTVGVATRIPTRALCILDAPTTTQSSILFDNRAVTLYHRRSAARATLERGLITRPTDLPSGEVAIPHGTRSPPPVKGIRRYGELTACGVAAEVDVQSE